MFSRKKYVSYDKNLVVNVISDHPISIDKQTTKKIIISDKMLGKRIPRETIDMTDFKPRTAKDLRVALVCNWNSQCGISTYTKFLTDSMIPMVKELKIFSEVAETPIDDTGYNVDRCWKRGENLLPMINKVLDWSPDFIISQHEFGLFPNAFYFMQMNEKFSNIPHVIAMHSVYEHLDKLVYTECVKNIVVHTENGKSMLKKLGNTSNVFVIPHGCVKFNETDELWNTFQNPYTVMQFGFGFSYKGVDRAIKALHHLKTTDKKFENIFYYYLLSDNAFNSSVNYKYSEDLQKLVKDLGMENNVSIIKKFQTEQMLNLYLRTAKLIIFPYVNKDNIVYGASGAIRIALANKRPVIASESHLFDDFEGVLPRPKDHLELAAEIDKIFSSQEYRDSIINKGYNYIQENSWDVTAAKYLELYNKVIA